MTTEPAPLVLAPSSMPVMLDLGCGENLRDGFEGVDLHGAKATHRVDLFKFPFPWADNSVDEINASHFIEHIPAREVEARDAGAHGFTLPPPSEYVGKDFLLAFMDECHRILKPDGWMTITVPCGRHNRAFQDPTHRRFIVEETFLYFSARWREVNVPQYPVKCNFETVSIVPIVPTELNLRTQEVAMNMMRERWNVVLDLQAKLKAIK